MVSPPIRSRRISLFALLLSSLTCVIVTVNTIVLRTTGVGAVTSTAASGATFGTDAFRFWVMRMRDGYGRVPPDGYMRARARVDLLKWAGATRRVESGFVAPVGPQTFDASAPAPASSVNVNAAAWRTLGPGNIGGRIRAIAISPVDPNVIYAGSAGGGIWKTIDGGRSWLPLDDFMAVLSISSIVIDPAKPAVMYAATGEGYGNGDAIRGAGIFKSADAGDTWSQLAPTALWGTVNRLSLSPDGRVMLAATPTGIFRSKDAGATFTRVLAQPVMDVDISSIDGLRAAAAGSGRISYSLDGGATWRASSGVPASAGRIEVAYARSQPETIYALADYNEGTLYRSTDAGATFVEVSNPRVLQTQGWYANTLWVNPIDSNHIVTCGMKPTQSFDGGATWAAVAPGIHPDCHVVVSDPRFDDAGNLTVLLGNDGGVFRISNIRTAQTSGFESLNNGLGVTQFYSGAASIDGGTIVGGTQDNGTLLRAPWSGTSWQTMVGGDGGFTATDPGDASFLYTELPYLRLYRSADGGANWTSFAGGLADAGSAALFIAPFALDPNNPNTLLAGGASLWRSTNIRAASPSWTQAIGNGGSDYVSAIAVAATDSNVIWAARASSRIYKSVNGTATPPAFTTVVAPTGGKFVTRIVISPADANTVYITTGGFAADNIVKTTDGGGTWTRAAGAGTTALPSVPVHDLEVDPADANVLYAGTEVGVFVSRDAGSTWDVQQGGPANVCVDELFWMGSTLIAATHGRGMFAVDLGGAAGSGSPTATVSPTSLSFARRPAGSASAPQTVTVANTGSANLTVSTVTMSHPAEFSIADTNCSGVTLPPGASCVIHVIFKASVVGDRAADLTISDNAPYSPQILHMTGIADQPPQTLPSPWTSQDIGATQTGGWSSYSGGTFSVTGAGADVWGTADAFQFAHRPLSGDGAIVARVATVENVQPWTKAGVMIRDGLMAGAANAAMIVAAGKGLSFQYRKAAGGTTANVLVPGAPPRWVKLARTAGVITASTSPDGQAWTVVGHATIAMAAKVEAGLALASHSTIGQPATGTFDGVSLTSAAALPSGWQSGDVGQVGVAGSASAAGGLFTLSGSGADIWGTADAFQFAHRTLAADGQVIARVASVENTHRWAKAGVMIRQSLAASSPFVDMIVSSTSGTAFQYRSTAGGATTSVPGAVAPAPRWVKIVRAGSNLSGYQSADGVNWQVIGRAVVSMTGPVEVGLVVTSHDNTRLAKATFDQVQ
ncbi:MAG: hypothetical protein JWL71_154 [Acidobacteria bacterium]|nr:hypothetical protein [Acidobacteriota bacterium]